MTYIGNCRLGDLFESRRERGRPGLPLLSVTMNDGLVDRDDLDRKQDSALTPEEHLLVKPGDIAYNMMRMWQGAFGLASREGMVSPAYVVLRPKIGVDTEYMAQLLGTRRMLYLLWAYSHGLTEDRLRLYFDDFAAIPVTVPSAERQRQLAGMLTLWDTAIDTACSLVTNSLRTKKAVVAEIFGRPGERKRWRALALGEMASFRNGLNFTRTAAGEAIKIVGVSDFRERSQLADTADLETVRVADKVREADLLQSGDLLFVRSNGNKALIGRCLYFPIVSERVSFSGFTIRGRFRSEAIDPLFAAHLMRTDAVRDQMFTAGSGTNISNLSQAILANIRVEVPPLHEQRTIALALDRCDQSVVVAQKYVEALRRQKEALFEHVLRADAVNNAGEPIS